MRHVGEAHWYDRLDVADSVLQRDDRRGCDDDTGLGSADTFDGSGASTHDHRSREQDLAPELLEDSRNLHEEVRLVDFFRGGCPACLSAWSCIDRGHNSPDVDAQHVSEERLREFE